MAFKRRSLILMLVPTLLAAQDRLDVQKILDRLDRLEQENRNLTSEIHGLREELAASHMLAPSPPSEAAAPIEERVAVQERRIEEQSQTKVEASQKLPVTLTGMVLFNAYLNGKASGGQQNPTAASAANSTTAGGANLSQSVLGLQFQGPRLFGDGRVTGALYMDFFGGGNASSLNHTVRLRVATVDLAWKHTSVVVGQDKPIIAPREPNSLAQVGVSPLTGAGNLWLWQPQARIEQRYSFGEQAGVRADLGVYQTSEPSFTSRGGDTGNPVSAARPALEGRFEFWKKFGSSARIEIAPGFHSSTSHVAGISVPSDLFTIDWMIQPVSKVQLTGMFFQGENTAGVGGLRQGFTVFKATDITPVHAAGGWAQLSYLATKRVSFNLYGGQESDRAADLLTGDVHRNLTYAGNVIYRLGPNVLLGLEASQVRTNYFHTPARLNNHYDLALGYLF